MPKKHILYIEDHEDTRELVSFVLKQRNYEVTTSSNIANGVRLACENRYDLYLVDSWLPDGTGLDLCRRIREFDGSTPILFYSAAAYEIDRELALNNGAQGYLTKPTQNTELCDLVAQLINGRNNGQG
jgi:two-component system alkaline phosphatase synthesis response regulator PhoP